MVGTMTKEGFTKKQNGSLYCIESGGKVSKFKSGFYTPNGLAFNKAGNTMYFADTGKEIQTIWSFNYNLKNGLPSNQKIFANTENLKGRPDGGTVDIDAFYWSASVEGSQLIRYNLSGEIDISFDLPITKPTKPVFGGKDYKTIFITSIGRELEDLNGSVLALTQHNFKGFSLSNFNY